jgi:hypothetical protein
MSCSSSWFDPLRHHKVLLVRKVSAASGPYRIAYQPYLRKFFGPNFEFEATNLTACLSEVLYAVFKFLIRSNTSSQSFASKESVRSEWALTNLKLASYSAETASLEPKIWHRAPKRSCMSWSSSWFDPSRHHKILLVRKVSAPSGPYRIAYQPYLRKFFGPNFEFEATILTACPSKVLYVVFKFLIRSITTSQSFASKESVRCEWAL